MTYDPQDDETTMHRFLVDWEIQGSVEIELPGNASDDKINKAAREEIYKQFTRGRSLLADIQIGMVDGPY